MSYNKTQLRMLDKYTVGDLDNAKTASWIAFFFNLMEKLK